MAVPRTPSPISSLAYGPCSALFAGSDDGSLRVYSPSSPKVLKAVSGLGSEISSIVPLKINGRELGDVWLACGRRIFSFNMDLPKLIMTSIDAKDSIELCNDKGDVLNELTLSSNSRYLAFSQDTGVVGVVDLETKLVSRMKRKHDSICSTVKFIPGRPTELVSGGYDQMLFHFNSTQGTLLSQRNLAAASSPGEMTMAPPFVTSTALSSNGIMAVGTADGRLWLGFGGEKFTSPSSKKKKKVKWGGLREENELFVKVAEGPVVALVFTGPATLIFCTLLGKSAQCCISRAKNSGAPSIETMWTKETEHVAKVNALAANDQNIAIGGLDKGGKGVIEIWVRNTICPDEN